MKTKQDLIWWLESHQHRFTDVSDEIWAHPETITGSIGVFGIIPTFERALDEIGVNKIHPIGTSYGGFIGAELGATIPTTRSATTVFPKPMFNKLFSICPSPSAMRWPLYSTFWTCSLSFSTSALASTIL